MLFSVKNYKAWSLLGTRHVHTADQQTITDMAEA